MTQKQTLAQQSGSSKKLSCSDSGSLVSAIERHCAKERASFHTPGHKGGANFRCGQNLWALDVTELPGLDELSYATGVLARLQERAAEVWKTRASYISTNGASAAMIAAIIACADRGTHVLMPTNVHRAAINALVLTGLKPVWYRPGIDTDWQTCSDVEHESFVQAIAATKERLAAAVVVSPAYSGAVSDIMSLSAQCRIAGIPLIVDEAHGAHLSARFAMPPNAVDSGADLVVHSVHKTLSAMTQTGILHVGRNSSLDENKVRLALNMVLSSSPSYVLMSSIETAINEFENGFYIERALLLAERTRRELSILPAVQLFRGAYHDPLHVVVRIKGMPADELLNELAQRGVFAEAEMGTGVLLLFGVGTTEADADLLIDAIGQIAQSKCCIGTNATAAGSHTVDLAVPVSPTVQQTGVNEFLHAVEDQVLSPSEAFYSPSEIVPVASAIGRIAAECVAPCPPGSPVIVPGQRISAAAMQFCKLPELRVVVSHKGEQ